MNEYVFAAFEDELEKIAARYMGADGKWSAFSPKNEAAYQKLMSRPIDPGPKPAVSAPPSINVDNGSTISTGAGSGRSMFSPKNEAAYQKLMSRPLDPNASGRMAGSGNQGGGGRFQGQAL